MNVEGDGLIRVLAFLNRLDDANIYYTLDHNRPESIMVSAVMPDLRWEIEFMADGTVEIERFRSVAGVEVDEGILEDLFRDL